MEYAANQTFGVQYGTGIALGRVGFADVTVNGIKVPYQKIGLVDRTKESGGGVGSGVLGLGFLPLTSPHPGAELDNNTLLLNRAVYDPVFVSMPSILPASSARKPPYTFVDCDVTPPALGITLDGRTFWHERLGDLIYRGVAGFCYSSVAPTGEDGGLALNFLGDGLLRNVVSGFIRDPMLQCRIRRVFDVISFPLLPSLRPQVLELANGSSHVCAPYNPSHLCDVASSSAALLRTDSPEHFIASRNNGAAIPVSGETFRRGFLATLADALPSLVPRSMYSAIYNTASAVSLGDPPGTPSSARKLDARGMRET
ncbi:hypothetical protein DL770_000667 [Monosporascus sp. CRB-9-2]|nr:hypothetical protein DL770_000667 [Monosporascus sp. CRB-9-2]